MGFTRSLWLLVATGHGKVLIPALFGGTPLHPPPFTSQHLQATGGDAATDIVSMMMILSSAPFHHNMDLLR
jgi:hypothetical protein